MLTAKFNSRLTFIFLSPSEDDVPLSLASRVADEGSAVHPAAVFSAGNFKSPPP